MPKSRIPKPYLKNAKPPRLTNEQTRVTLEQSAHQFVMFSFRFVDINHSAFNLGGIEIDWVIALLRALQDICSLTRVQFQTDQATHYQVHPIRWSHTEYPQFETLPGDWEQWKDDCYQFRLTRSLGRIHGVFIEHVFYVVWLDPHHNLSLTDHYGTGKQFSAPLTPYEQLLHEHQLLQIKYQALWDMLNDQTNPRSS